MLEKKKPRKPLNYNDFRESTREVPTRFELVIRVLQTHALPLGYGTIFDYKLSDSDGN